MFSISITTECNAKNRSIKVVKNSWKDLEKYKKEYTSYMKNQIEEFKRSDSNENNRRN